MIEMTCRLPHDADTPLARAEYLYTRARQLLSLGYTVDYIKNEPEGVDGKAAMFLKKDDKAFASLYLSPGARGKGALKHFAQEVSQTGTPIITIRDCNIAGYLEFQRILHVVEAGHFDSDAYGLIEDYYGNRTAKRSGVWLMNHIDEGLTVLAKLNAPKEAFSIFCLHPLVQNDVDLTSNSHLIEQYPHLNWQGAFGYRETANAYLAHRDISSINDIELSGDVAVNFALIADKVQNYKDFMVYHYGTHKDSDRLFNYFHNWFDKLAISNKLLIDLLNHLMDNDYMKSITKEQKGYLIPRILTHTQVERESRMQHPHSVVSR